MRWLLVPVVVAVAAAIVLIPLRHTSYPPSPPIFRSWSMELRRVDDALAMEQIGTAIRAWGLARAAARANDRWDALLAVGDAYLRIGDAVEFRRAFVASARHSYLEALDRARHSESVEGAVRVAAALAMLDDRPGIAQAIRVACDVAVSRQPLRDEDVRLICDRVIGALPSEPSDQRGGDAS